MQKESEFVTFKIGDDPLEYKLAFDFNEVVDAETIVGMNLMPAVTGGSVNAIQTRGLLYACLKTGHPDVTIADAGELLTRDLDVTLDAMLTLLISVGARRAPEGA